MICINKSLETGIVPTVLKQAKIVPLYKSGSKEEATNYRPISLLPVFSKLLEKTVYNQFSKYFEQFITPVQFGFRTKHSTVHCILNFLNNVSANRSSKYHVSVFLDLKKAFDTVPHNVLIEKLKSYGVKQTELAWFSNYLSGRGQSTCVRNATSALENILCGVPQGSILGPLLFFSFY